ncbi:MAG: hypothetical protein RMK99_08120 [Anaerolineales bacterium]|nr:hypothetical protein [Anaerolineales bacterium]
MTTRVEVFAGICGYSAVIEVNKVDETHVQVIIHSECTQITSMNPDLANLRWKGKGHEVFKRMPESAVYQSAARHIRHTACPVPAAILKAIEVETGVALPKDVTIKFLNSDAKDGSHE